MAWGIPKIERTTDNQNIVTVSVQFDDQTYGLFLYKELRVDITNISQAQADFVSRANAAKDAKPAEEAPTARELALQTALNA